MKCFATILSCTFAIMGLSCLHGSERPNILFILSDDHAAQAISAYDNRLIQTPNLDRIADEGMLLQNAFCTTAICGPSRASILTGKFGFLNGVMNNETSEFEGSQQTFVKLLNSHGYRTAIFGKWHLGSDPTGFDEWEVLINQGEYYNPRFKTPSGTVQFQGHTTNIIADKAIGWLREHADDAYPFLLMTHFKATHRSWMPAPEDLPLFRDGDMPVPSTLFDDYADNASPVRHQKMQISRDLYPEADLKITPPLLGLEDELIRAWPIGEEQYTRMTPEQRKQWDAYYVSENEAFAENPLKDPDERTRYYYQRYIKDYLRTAAGIDRNVGRILDYLEANGLAENTIVIYSSDQGFYLGENGWYDKRWAYDISMRMPFLIRWPQLIKPGVKVSELIQAIDFAPTLLDLAGIKPPFDMQGKSFAKILSGEEIPWREYVYYRYVEDAWHNVAPHVGLRSADAKLIYFYETDEWEYYDLVNDPGELKNAYADPQYRNNINLMKQEMENLRVHYRDTTIRYIPGTQQPRAVAPVVSVH